MGGARLFSWAIADSLCASGHVVLVTLVSACARTYYMLHYMYVCTGYILVPHVDLHDMAYIHAGRSTTIYTFKVI